MGLDLEFFPVQYEFFVPTGRSFRQLCPGIRIMLNKLIKGGIVSSAFGVVVSQKIGVEFFSSIPAGIIFQKLTDFIIPVVGITVNISLAILESAESVTV